MSQNLATHTVAVNRNLLLQAISYLKQHDDPMSKMLTQQFQFALCQEALSEPDKPRPQGSFGE
jgi:hypothetical protein